MKRASQLSLKQLQKFAQRPGGLDTEIKSQITVITGLRTRLKGMSDNQVAAAKADTTSLAPGRENYDGESGLYASGRWRMDAISQQAKRHAREDADRAKASQGRMGVYSTSMKQ